MAPAAQTGGPAPQCACTIIICTLAVAERAASINRAIDSVLTQNDTPTAVLVVVNGDRHDAGVLAALEARDDISLIKIPQKSLSEAIVAGRRAVTTPYFGFLDDDDEYLAHAVDLRLAALEQHPAAGVLVTNGHRRTGDLEERVMNHIELVTADPLEALFREPWLASCSALYRAAVVPVSMFEGIARYFEWTWLGFVIASAGIGVRTLDVPTFRIHDTANSESKSDAYMMAQIAIFERMLAHASRADIRARLKGRIRDGWHSRAVVALARGERGEAWRCHLHCLATAGGWRYLSFTRYLVPGWPRNP